MDPGCQRLRLGHCQHKDNRFDERSSAKSDSIVIERQKSILLTLTGK